MPRSRAWCGCARPARRRRPASTPGSTPIVAEPALRSRPTTRTPCRSMSVTTTSISPSPSRSPTAGAPTPNAPRCGGMRGRAGGGRPVVPPRAGVAVRAGSPAARDRPGPRKAWIAPSSVASDQLVPAVPVQVDERRGSSAGAGHAVGEPDDQVGVVVHEDLLLHLAVQPVAGAAVRGDDHSQPDGEALLVGPARGRVDRRARAAAGQRGRRSSRGRAWRAGREVGWRSPVRLADDPPRVGGRVQRAAGARAPTRPGSRRTSARAAATVPVTATVPVAGSTSNHGRSVDHRLGRDAPVAHRLQHLVDVDAAVAEGRVPALAWSGSGRCRAAASRSACRSCWPGRPRWASRSRCRRRSARTICITSLAVSTFDPGAPWERRVRGRRPARGRSSRAGRPSRPTGRSPPTSTTPDGHRRRTCGRRSSCSR